MPYSRSEAPDTFDSFHLEIRGLNRVNFESKRASCRALQEDTGTANANAATQRLAHIVLTFSELHGPL